MNSTVTKAEKNISFGEIFKNWNPTVCVLIGPTK